MKSKGRKTTTLRQQPIIYVSSLAVFAPQQWSWILVTGTVSFEKPKIFTIWPLQTNLVGMTKETLQVYKLGSQLCIFVLPLGPWSFMWPGSNVKVLCPLPCCLGFAKTGGFPPLVNSAPRGIHLFPINPFPTPWPRIHNYRYNYYHLKFSYL